LAIVSQSASDSSATLVLRRHRVKIKSRCVAALLVQKTLTTQGFSIPFDSVTGMIDLATSPKALWI
jgi:hypothetical protein